MINQEPHVWFGRFFGLIILALWFLKILKLPSFYSGNFKIFKNALGQFIPNHTRKHVITSTYSLGLQNYALLNIVGGTGWIYVLYIYIFGFAILSTQLRQKEVDCLWSSALICLTNIHISKRYSWLTISWEC